MHWKAQALAEMLPQFFPDDERDTGVGGVEKWVNPVAERRDSRYGQVAGSLDCQGH